MKLLTHAVSVLSVLLVLPVSQGSDQKQPETLASLKNEHEVLGEELNNGRKPGTTEAEKKKAVECFYKSIGDLGRRAVALAKKHPGTPDAVEALVWAYSVATENDPEFAGIIYGMIAERYLDFDAILPLCRFAGYKPPNDTNAEEFLRAAMKRSANVKVRSLCCFSLGRHQQELASAARDLNDPVRGEARRRDFDRFGPVVNRRLRALDTEKLEREAEECFNRTIKEFGDLQPLGKEVGKDSAPLGELATGMLFKMRHLGIGRTAPEIEGEDIDGKPMKLSDFRGKVVLVAFWATWCVPCMARVPLEKALVEKMKDRPFVLIGVNGDDDRDKVKTVSAKEGISWRSFWNGGARKGIPLQWGIRGWGTTYVIDANGVVRDDSLVYIHELFFSDTPNKLIETLVAEVEKASKR